MFKCQRCKKTSKHNEQQNKCIVETRSVTYYDKTRSTDDEGNEIMLQGSPIGQGTEIVQEINVCGRCIGSN